MRMQSWRYWKNDLKKFRLWTGFKPATVALPMKCSTDWAIKATWEQSCVGSALYVPFMFCPMTLIFSWNRSKNHSHNKLNGNVPPASWTFISSCVAMLQITGQLVARDLFRTCKKGWVEFCKKRVMLFWV